MSCYFAIEAIDFRGKTQHTSDMLRFMLTGVLVLLAIVLVLVGYQMLILGTGVAGALALLHRYWWEATSVLNTTQRIEWVGIIVLALIGAWRTSKMPRFGKY